MPRKGRRSLHPLSLRQDIVAEIPGVRRYARALTGDAGRADDLVQDTLERALTRLALWRPGSLRAWLFSIMHNLYINQLRDARRLEYAPDEDLPELPVRAAQSDGLEMRDLDRLLACLPLEQREVLLLVGLEELSYAEAARALGVPVGTVMSRLSRARDRLRTLMAGGAEGVHLRVVK
ncbi:MAG: sigma-70 family RNA polymerase sigma factor [Betaproteobacteria bacterium]|nr:sigma-70 family RNA polymerase sigma factor [Betaproteobacteria bacterium]